MYALEFTGCNAAEYIHTNSEVRSLGPNPLSTSYDLSKFISFYLRYLLSHMRKYQQFLPFLLRFVKI